MTDLWTLAELATRAAVALGGAAEQASARVREIPDARTIRWYQTTGLIDRPLALRGRTALYGRRQLLQLVAIKRLQAQGRSLAEIQAELAGLSTEALESLADLPPQPLPTHGFDVVRDDKTMIRTRFWTDRNHGTPPSVAAPAAGRAAELSDQATAGDDVGERVAAARPTTPEPAAPPAPPTGGEAAADRGDGGGRVAAARHPTPEPAVPAVPPTPTTREESAVAAQGAAEHAPAGPDPRDAPGQPAYSAERGATRAADEAAAEQAASTRSGGPGTAGRAAAFGRAAFGGAAGAAGGSAVAGSPAAAPAPTPPPPGEAGWARETDPERAAAADALSLQGVRLADDVLLILDHPAGAIEPADVEALREAAAPLLDALVRRGLVAHHTRTKEPA